MPGCPGVPGWEQWGEQDGERNLPLCSGPISCLDDCLTHCLSAVFLSLGGHKGQASCFYFSPESAFSCEPPGP